MAIQFPSTLKDGQCVLVPVDVKQNKSYPPSVHCAPIDAAKVLDDRALICRNTTADGKAHVTVRFASELGGPFGAGVSEDYQHWHNAPAGSFAAIFKPIGLLMAKFAEPDTFSQYAFEVSDDGQISVNTAANHYAVDNRECAMRAIAGAFACWGYGVEDASLVQFGGQFYASDTRTDGVALPNEDRIDAQKGDVLSRRTVSAAVPTTPLIPLAADIATRPLGLLPISKFSGNPHFLGAMETVNLDVKANYVMPFNINFAPINAKVVTNDVAQLDWMTDPKAVIGSDEPPFICVRLKSEVGGPLGAVVANDPKDKEGLSPYQLCVNDDKQVYAQKKVGDKDQKFKVDSIERAAFAIASVLGAYAYNNANMNISMKRFADQLYANRSQLTTAGEALPKQDQLANQTKTYNYDSVQDMLDQSAHVQAEYKKSFGAGFCAGMMRAFSMGDTD